jgi:hypothetical protein
LTTICQHYEEEFSRKEQEIAQNPEHEHEQTASIVQKLNALDQTEQGISLVIGDSEVRRSQVLLSNAA